jgi:hypothetical protein
MKVVVASCLVVLAAVVAVAPSIAAPVTYWSENFESYNVPVGMRAPAPGGPGWLDNWGGPADIFVTSTSNLGTKAMDGKSMTTNSLGELKDLTSYVPTSGKISMSYDAWVEGFGAGQGTSQCSFGFGDRATWVPQLWWEYTGNGTGWVLREWITTSGITDYAVGMIGSSEAVSLGLTLDLTNKKFQASLARKSDGFVYYLTSWIPYVGAATGNAIYMRQQYWNGDTISGMSVDNINVTNGEAAVPEPSSLLALGMGGLGLLGSLARRKRQ